MALDAQDPREVLDGPVGGQAQEAPRQPDVLAHREVGQESTDLQHIADVALAQIRESVLAAGLP
ncbi:MAG: hypothetical protein ACREVJ_02455, partial [Gammaproteobacteria bacterium]